MSKQARIVLDEILAQIRPEARSDIFRLLAERSPNWRSVADRLISELISSPSYAPGAPYWEVSGLYRDYAESLKIALSNAFQVLFQIVQNDVDHTFKDEKSEDNPRSS